MQQSQGNTIHWFRKCLRIHDNPALLEAVQNGKHFFPIFILDPWFVKNMKIGFNRWRFLAQSLQDLDNSLCKFNSRLFVIRGRPTEVFPKIVKQWKIKLLTFEQDTEPYAKQRDEEIGKLMETLDVEVHTFCTNTLYNPEKLIEYHGKVPLTMQAFLNVVDKVGLPSKPVQSAQQLTELLLDREKSTPIEDTHNAMYGVPTLEELGVNTAEINPCLYPGGESEALLRLNRVTVNEHYIRKFAKPDTSPNSIEPSTTVLSPYVKFGCLSARTFYYKIRDIYLKSKSGYTKPPVSLHGQLFWHEFFYTAGSAIPNFDQMLENPICTQIPWNDNKQFLCAWAYAQTGYPFIDAIMTQLRKEGWIHHLARHAVACFLTRGDLWISWEQGMKVFEELLLDADWSLNAANWMWLSCSAFFHQYFRVYSPIAFGKKTDKNGDYIRKYVPILKKFPPEYIYEPWKAPRKLQEQLGCIIGKDYPNRIVDHDKVRVENIKQMDAAYKAKKEMAASKSGNTIAETKPKTQHSKLNNPNQKTGGSKRSKSSETKITKFLKFK